MKKLRSSPSEHFLVIRVCQKCQKCKISEKPGFWRNCGYISKTVRSIFMIFWLKTPLTINKRRAKNFFQNFLPFLRNDQLCKNWNFSKTRFFYFFEIQNLSCQRPKFSGPQSSASSLDLFGQGKQFSEIFEVFLRLEGLNQKILLCKKVLEFNFMVP